MADTDILEDGENNMEAPGERARWTAALSYLAFLCFFSLWKADGDRFVRYHARQGFLLLFAEIVVLAVTLILDATIGRLRLVGMLIIGLIQLIAALGALTLSVTGFVKALFGEYWHLPILGDYREKVPGFRSQEE